MTKAENVFNDTYYSCLNYINTWGKETNPDGMPIGFANLISKDALYNYTFSCVQKCIDRKKSEIQLLKKYNIITQEEYDNRIFACNMVQVTLNNNIKQYKTFEK